jgi:1-aminocyclopropane-1-carboxylate deaminase
VHRNGLKLQNCWEGLFGRSALSEKSWASSLTNLISRTVPRTSITADWVHQHKVEVDILRADLIDPLISGNKFFKLQLNLQQAQVEGFTKLLSFGGAWSNHLHALAAAGNRCGIATIGIVRGEQGAALNPCLQDARDWGMQLHFVSRHDYACKTDVALLANWQAQFGPCYVIPEGGANRLGVLGCQALLPAQHSYTHILLACGTGTTMAGLVSVSRVPVIGIQVLKGECYLQREVARLLLENNLPARCAWEVLDSWHAGGYAKVSPSLLDFMQRFELATGVPLEPIYSAKLMQAMVGLIEQNYFPVGSRLLVVHGGGLQGRRSFLELRA